MALILLDADVVISGERRRFELGAWLATRPEDTFALAAITVAELWMGVERASGGLQGRRRSYLQPLLEALPVLEYGNATAMIHARIWAELDAAGARIGAHDLLVAATALASGGAVATFHRRHFVRVRGLTVITPASEATPR